MEPRLIRAMRNGDRGIRFFNDPRVDLFLERRSEGVYQLISRGYEHIMVTLDDSLWGKLQNLYDQSPSIFESASHKHRFISVNPKMFDLLIAENILKEEELFDEVTPLYIRKGDVFLLRTGLGVYSQCEIRRVIYNEVEASPMFIEIRSLFQHPELYRGIFQDMLWQVLSVNDESMHPLMDLLNNLLNLKEDFGNAFKELVA